MLPLEVAEVVMEVKPGYSTGLLTDGSMERSGKELGALDIIIPEVQEGEDTWRLRSPWASAAIEVPLDREQAWGSVWRWSW